MEKVQIPALTNKGELMKIAYKGNLFNVDSATPMEYWSRINCFWYVMDYNTDRIFGELRHLANVARSNGMELEWLGAPPMPVHSVTTIHPEMMGCIINIQTMKGIIAAAIHQGEYDKARDFEKLDKMEVSALHDLQNRLIPQYNGVVAKFGSSIKPQ